MSKGFRPATSAGCLQVQASGQSVQRGASLADPAFKAVSGGESTMSLFSTYGAAPLGMNCARGPGLGQCRPRRKLGRVPAALERDFFSRPAACSGRPGLGAPVVLGVFQPGAGLRVFFCRRR